MRCSDSELHGYEGKESFFALEGELDMTLSLPHDASDSRVSEDGVVVDLMICRVPASSISAAVCNGRNEASFLSMNRACTVALRRHNYRAVMPFHKHCAASIPVVKIC